MKEAKKIKDKQIGKEKRMKEANKFNEPNKSSNKSDELSEFSRLDCLFVLAV